MPTSSREDFVNGLLGVVPDIADRGPDAIASNRGLGEQLGPVPRELVSRGQVPGRGPDGLEIALKGGQIGAPACFNQGHAGAA